MTNNKIPLYTVPVASTSFTMGAYLDGSGTSPAIRYGYREGGSEYDGGIEFHSVSAFRKRAERCCSSWHIKDNYDTLVEVEDSTWAKEIRSDMFEMYRDKWELHHYMIYLDSSGCFEFVAESWAALPLTRLA